MSAEKFTFNVDFDGTAVSHDFPNVGKDIGAQRVLKRLTDNGHKLILFTMRSDRSTKGETGDARIKDVTGFFLRDAIDWFKQNDIPLYGIQKDPSQGIWTTSPKSYADYIIDDSALGVPLKTDLSISKRPFVDWEAIEKMLIDLKII